MRSRIKDLPTGVVGGVCPSNSFMIIACVDCRAEPRIARLMRCLKWILNANNLNRATSLWWVYIYIYIYTIRFLNLPIAVGAKCANVQYKLYKRRHCCWSILQSFVSVSYLCFFSIFIFLFVIPVNHRSMSKEAVVNLYTQQTNYHIFYLMVVSWRNFDYSVFKKDSCSTDLHVPLLL